jgi:hypothetical protein
LTRPRRLELVSRQDCELCLELLALLEPYVRGGTVVLDRVEPEDRPALLEHYQWRIPVLLEDGRELMWGRIDAAEVTAALGEPPA